MKRFIIQIETFKQDLISQLQTYIVYIIHIIDRVVGLDVLNRVYEPIYTVKNLYNDFIILQYLFGLRKRLFTLISQFFNDTLLVTVMVVVCFETKHDVLFVEVVRLCTGRARIQKKKPCIWSIYTARGYNRNHGKNLVNLFSQNVGLNVAG